MKTHLKRLFSGVLSVVMAISAIPFVSAHAEENNEPYPYTMFAASNEAGAISVNAGKYTWFNSGAYRIDTLNQLDYYIPEKDESGEWILTPYEK